MQSRFFTAKEINKYGMQVVLLPYIETVTKEMRYKIIGICNGKQIKISETGKPLQAISELNNYFLKFSKSLKNISEIQIKKIEDNLVTLEEVINDFDTKLKLIEDIPKQAYLETLPMRSKDEKQSLLYYCKLLNIKGYTKLSKEKLISEIINKYINIIKN